MFAANTYVIRLATDEVAESVSRLAELDSRAPLAGRALICQIDGAPAAAISIADGRIVADPLHSNGYLLACLRQRAQALRAYEATPSLPDRMLAALPATYRSAATAQPRRPKRDRITTGRFARLRPRHQPSSARARARTPV